MARYEKPKAGEWVQPITKGYKLACCDCGLVHRINFKIVKDRKKIFKDKIQFQVFRDNRATARMRHANGITVKVRVK